MSRIKHILMVIALLMTTSNASAVILDFNDPANLGVTTGGGMRWHGTGGGHLYLEGFPTFVNPFAFPDLINFDSETYVNSFQLNAMPWEGASFGVESLNINAYDSAGAMVWSTSFLDIGGVSELSQYTDWNNWLTVSVETAGIKQLAFIQHRGPGGGNNQFFPSIDNLVINETTPVPEPSAIVLLGLGLLGLGLAGKNKKSA